MAESVGAIFYTVDMDTQPLIDKAQAAEKAVTDLGEAMKKADKGAAQAQSGVKSVTGAGDKLATSAKQAGAATAQLGQQLQNAGAGATAATAKVTPLAAAIRGINAASGSGVSGLQAVAAAAGLAAAALSTVVAAAVASGTAVVMHVHTAAQELQRFAALANTSTTEFQRLAIAGQVFGLSTEKVGDIMKDVNDKVGDFMATGGGELKDFFEVVAPRVGVTADQFKNLSGPDALQLYVNTLQKANVTQAEMVFYMEAIANDAALLLPVLQNNGEALKVLGDEAERAGAIMSADTIKASNDLAAAQFLLDQAMSGVANEISATLMPMLTGAAVELADFAVESGLAKGAAELLKDSIELLATWALGVKNAFVLAGKAIAGWAFVAKAALTPGESAAQAYKIANQDLLDTIAGLKTGIKDLGDVTKDDKTAERLAAITKAMEEFRKANKDGVVGKNAKQLEDEKKAAKAAADAAARAAKQQADAAKRGAEENSKALENLREQLNQTSLSGADLAARQAELSMNKYATPEQIEQAKALARQLYEVKDAAQKLEQRKQAFGNDPIAAIKGQVDPLSGGRFDNGSARYEAEKQAEVQRYADQQKRLQEAMDLQLITKQQYQTLEEQLYGEHIARMNQIDTARRDAQLEMWSSGFGNMADDLAAFATTFGDKTSAMFKLSQAAAVAQTVIQTYASAQSAYAAMAAIPVVGPALGIAAAGAAIAGGMARVAAIRSQSISGGRLYGGPVSANSLYRVNENGAPEVFNAANGRQYMIPNTRGEVVSNANATASPPGGSMGYSAAPIYQTIQVTGTVDNRTASQIARAAAERQQIAQSRFGR